MKNNFLIWLLTILCAISVPAMTEADIKSTPSSDIVAEVDFLRSILPKLPQNVRFGNSDERAILNFLASYAICEGWYFSEYNDLVVTFERELQTFVPAGQTFYIGLSERSYKARAEKGCQVDETANRAVEQIVGDVGDYFWGLKRRGLILEAIAKRRNELLRRTLGIIE